MTLNSRASAAEIISRVVKQQASLDALLEKIPEQKDLGFIKELCFGTLRWYHRLNKVAELLLTSALPAKNFDIHCLLLVGLYQLIYLKTPAHAAVSETVNGAPGLKKAWAKALINKTLRLFIANEAKILAKADATEEGFYSHPQWLIGKLKKAYPENYQSILNHNNQRAPLSLRVNLNKINRENYLALLSEHHITAHIFEEVPSAVQLKDAVPVTKIPGFFEGLCSVQDLAGQLATLIIDPQKGQRILDACAAPGSKTSHLLETQANLTSLVAVDISEERLNKLKENLQRLQLNSNLVEIVVADASCVNSWGQEALFDVILLDAPCSGTGVIRRHPDIKLLRRPEDITEQTRLQNQLLSNLWPLLKPGGHLLYSTCSILPEENEKQINFFLTHHPEAQSIPILTKLGVQLSHGLQILPGDHDADGFYYCLLQKTTVVD